MIVSIKEIQTISQELSRLIASELELREEDKDLIIDLVEKYFLDMKQHLLVENIKSELLKDKKFCQQLIKNAHSRYI